MARTAKPSACRRLATCTLSSHPGNIRGTMCELLRPQSKLFRANCLRRAAASDLNLVSLRFHGLRETQCHGGSAGA